MELTDQKEINRYSRLDSSVLPLTEGENITPNFKEPETIIVSRLNCIVCGKISNMGVKDMITGEWKPIDKCRDCFCYGSYIPINEQITLNEKS